MKRLISFILMAFVFLSACSATTDGGQGENVETGAAVIETLDLNGATVLFYTNWPQHYRPDEVLSAEGDAFRARMSEVETNNNCVIDVTNPTAGVLPTIQAALMAGDPAHLCDTEAKNTYTLYKADALVAFEDITTIDLSNEEKWGPAYFRQHGIYNGLTYGVHRLYTWTFIPEADGIIMVNNEEIKEYAFDSPYEMFEKNEWTWENFEKMLQTYTTVSSNGTDPVFALDISDLNTFMSMSIFSNGGEIARKNEDGSLSFAASEPNALEAMEWVATLNKNKYIKMKIEDFYKGDNLFAATPVYMATSTSDGMKAWAPTFNMEDYFIINSPYGPKGTYGSSSGYVHTNRRLISIINSNDSEVSTENLGSILSQINVPLVINGKATNWQDYTGRASLHYPDNEIPMLETIIEGAHYDYSVHLGTEYTKLTTKFNTIFTNKGTPAAAMAEIAEALNIALNAE